MCCKSRIMLQLCSNLQQHGDFSLGTSFNILGNTFTLHYTKSKKIGSQIWISFKYAAFQLFCSTICSKYAK